MVFQDYEKSAVFSSCKHSLLVKWLYSSKIDQACINIVLRQYFYRAICFSQQWTIGNDGRIRAFGDYLCLSNRKIPVMRQNRCERIEADIKWGLIVQDCAKPDHHVFVIGRTEYIHGRYAPHECDVLQCLMGRAVRF